MDRPEITPPSGYPHLKYAQIERERRWLCDVAPAEALASSDVSDIVDIYLPQSHMRLRSAAPRDGTENFRRLTKKSQLADPRARLLTSIYLDDVEYQMVASLGGLTLAKSRHRIFHHGHRLAVDCFGGPLAGLVLAEVEFDDDTTMEAYPQPTFAVREVTADAAYTGYALARRAAGLAP